MRTLSRKLSAAIDVFRHFRRPLLVAMLRLGIVRLPYFVYSFRFEGSYVDVLARPSSRSMSDLYVIREVFVHQTYRDILPLLPSRPVSVVDVGANLGSFLIWLNHRHGVSTGFCFEPEPASVQLCRANLLTSGCDVSVIAAAAGATSRCASIHMSAGRPAGASIYGNGSQGSAADVQVINFPEWLCDRGIFDILKLDCEGSEWEIVRSPQASELRRCSLIVAEVHEDPLGIHQVDAFPGFLERSGFRIVRWDGHAHGLCIARLGAT